MQSQWVSSAVGGVRRVWVLCAMVVMTVAASAQLTGVTLRVLPTDIGVDGTVVPGEWVAARLRLVNDAALQRDVICRWTYRDVDGDRVAAERAVVLDTIQGEQAVWLYGKPQDGELVYRFEVVEAESGEVLFTVDQSPLNRLPRGAALIGVCGNHTVGLEPHAEHLTQHEPLRLARNLSLASLPDRWMGLDALTTLVWTPRDVGPEVADPAVLGALREWVHRGGRLVVVLPGRNQTWSRAVGDLLPVSAAQVQPVDADVRDMVRFLGTASGASGAVPVAANRFVAAGATATPVGEPAPGPPGSVLAGADGNVYAVTDRYGFGSVTVLGVDLTESTVSGLGLPQSVGDTPFWNRLMGWRAPVQTPDKVEESVRMGLQRPADRLGVRQLGLFVPEMVTMRGQVAMGVFAAAGLFMLYFVVAGLLLYKLLSSRGMVQYTWLAFLVVVAGFTAVSWSGAWLLQRKERRVAHVTVLDVIGTTGESHARSWVSLYAPTFGRLDVAVGPGDEGGGAGSNGLATPALPSGAVGPGFLDPQTYRLDAASPGALAVPMRSTAKQLELDYVGRVSDVAEGLSEPIGLFTGRVGYRVENGARVPAGELGHGLPGALENVLLVFCPGDPADARQRDAREPIVWRPDPQAWEPGQRYSVELPAGGYQRLVIEPRRPQGSFRIDLGNGPVEIDKTRWDDRVPEDNEGFLGELVTRGAGVREGLGGAAVSSGRGIVDELERLSFFDRLPPPPFRMGGSLMQTDQGFAYRRLLGRDFDLTHLLDAPRLIVLGHVRDTPLPVPLTVDGREVASSGHLVVRAIYDLEELP